MLPLRIVLVAMFIMGYLTIRIAQTNEQFILLRNIQGRYAEKESESNVVPGKPSGGSSEQETDEDKDGDSYSDDYEPSVYKNSTDDRTGDDKVEASDDHNPAIVNSTNDRAGDEKVEDSDDYNPAVFSNSTDDEDAGNKAEDTEDEPRAQLLNTTEPLRDREDIENDPAFIANTVGKEPFNPYLNPDYYNSTEDLSIPDFYMDKYSTYDCRWRYLAAGSHPKFMVLGVHKGGSTALYDYLIKHGRIRPAVCKEVHFFDFDAQYAKGKSFYLRHFPNVAGYKSRVITGEGSPSYIRDPRVPARFKAMFPSGSKFIVSLREPSARFISHWVGKHKGNDVNPLLGLSCDDAWNTSVSAVERCLESEGLVTCQAKLHDNPVMRGIYLPQIKRWLRYFPIDQFFLIQAEAMFRDNRKIVQQTVKFLNLRPYTEAELDSLQTAFKGSAHMGEDDAKQCDHLKDRIKEFYANFNHLLKAFLERWFPAVLIDWQPGWSGM